MSALVKYDLCGYGLSWDEWQLEWKEAKSLAVCLGLLHSIFGDNPHNNRNPANPAWQEKTRFLIKVAMGEIVMYDKSFSRERRAAEACETKACLLLADIVFKNRLQIEDLEEKTILEMMRFFNPAHRRPCFSAGRAGDVILKFSQGFCYDLWRSGLTVHFRPEIIEIAVADGWAEILLPEGDTSSRLLQQTIKAWRRFDEPVIERLKLHATRKYKTAEEAALRGCEYARFLLMLQCILPVVPELRTYTPRK